VVVTHGRVLLPGTAEGPLLRLSEPLSFWGGVDPRTGRISDPRHPEHGLPVVGTILAIPAPRGSSSSSAVMLELLSRGLAPAGLILGSVDAILALGVLVAREMGWRTIPVLELPAAEQATLPEGVLRITADGTIEPLPSPSPARGRGPG
jgi:predicted aconitase with swiveling domain